ncbi:hypothetical protein COOONC_14354 [Cooperia oncophora]
MLGAVIGRRQGGGRGHSGEYDRKPPMGGQGGHGGNGQQGGYGSHEGHGGPQDLDNKEGSVVAQAIPEATET